MADAISVCVNKKVIKLVQLEKSLKEALCNDDSSLYNFISAILQSEHVPEGFEPYEEIKSIARVPEEDVEHIKIPKKLSHSRSYISDEEDTGVDISDDEDPLGVFGDAGASAATAHEEIDDDLFISLVINRPALFQASLPVSARSRDTKEKLWLEIKTVLKTSLSTKELAKKWKTLYDYYIKVKPVIEKSEPSGSSSDNALKKKRKVWKHYPAMKAIEKVLQENSRVTSTNVKDIGLTTPPDINKVVVATPGQPKKRKRNDTDTTYQDEAFLKGLDAILNKEEPREQQQTEPEDDVSHFMKRLGSGMRKLPYKRRCKLEIEFLQLLYRELDDD